LERSVKEIAIASLCFVIKDIAMETKLMDQIVLVQMNV